MSEEWKDSKTGIALNIPNGWIEMEPENEKHSLLLVSPDLAINLVLGVSPLDTSIPAPELLARFQNQMIEIADPIVLRDEDITLNGLPGMFFKYSYSFNETDHLGVVQILIGDQVGYFVQFIGVGVDPLLNPGVVSILDSLEINQPAKLRPIDTSISPERLADIVTLLLLIAGVCFLFIVLSRRKN